MSSSSRTEKSILNVLTSVFGQLFSFVLSFTIRTVFIKTLGEVYLGLNGLYSNILSVLNLTEFGLGTAIVFELYRTVAKHDEEKTKQYLAFYKKAYICIGTIILIAGLCLVPFLHLFVNDVDLLGLINYRLVFVLYLLNTVFSYFFFAYRQSVLQANQQEYKIRIITYIFKAIEMVLQIVGLFIFKNIYIYLVVPLVLGCISTVTKGILIGKWYPYILEKPNGKLSPEELKETSKNVFSVALYKISGCVINSTDNIIISSFVSIVLTGLYSNYLIITAAVNTILEKVFSAFTASIGNLNVAVGDDVERKYNIFKTISFLNFWLYGFCSVCFCVLFKPFISIWIGQRFVMNSGTEIAIVVNFLLMGLQETVGTHRAAYGLFYKGRFRPIFSVLLNISFSILFVKIFPTEYGVVAVLLGTIFSNLFVSWWYDAYIVFKYAFDRKPWEFYGVFWLRVVYVLLICILFKAICNYILLPPVFSVVMYLGICCFGYNILFIVFFRKKPEFQYLWRVLIRLAGKVKRDEV